ncbi:hypothetical protein D3C74_287930 [compost metagenome]
MCYVGAYTVLAFFDCGNFCSVCFNVNYFQSQGIRLCMACVVYWLNNEFAKLHFKGRDVLSFFCSYHKHYIVHIVDHYCCKDAYYLGGYYLHYRHISVHIVPSSNYIDALWHINNRNADLSRGIVGSSGNQCMGISHFVVFV